GLVVWARCGETLNECDIDQAAWNGTSWVVTPLTASDALEEFPDTDGSLVVYHKITDQSTYWYGDSDICWQPVGGGTETCLELPGAQYQPRISAGIISFISAETGGGQGDVWIYRI